MLVKPQRKVLGLTETANRQAGAQRNSLSRGFEAVKALGLGKGQEDLVLQVGDVQGWRAGDGGPIPQFGALLQNESCRGPLTG